MASAPLKGTSPLCICKVKSHQQVAVAPQKICAQSSVRDSIRARSTLALGEVLVNMLACPSGCGSGAFGTVRELEDHAYAQHYQRDTQRVFCVICACFVGDATYASHHRAHKQQCTARHADASKALVAAAAARVGDVSGVGARHPAPNGAVAASGNQEDAARDGHVDVGDHSGDSPWGAGGEEAAHAPPRAPPFQPGAGDAAANGFDVELAALVRSLYAPWEGRVWNGASVQAGGANSFKPFPNATVLLLWVLFNTLSLSQKDMQLVLRCVFVCSCSVTLTPREQNRETRVVFAR